MVTPGRDPALALKSVIEHPPDAEHTLLFGSAVFSFAEPVHHRGPLKSEFPGAPLMLARPYDTICQVPGTVMMAPTDRLNVESPPNRPTLAPVTGATLGA